MYTAFLFLFVIGAAMAHDDMVKQMNDNYDRLDRLTTRIQNLKDTIEKRVSSRKEAQRKANNLLLRLDRLNHEDDDTFKCKTAEDGRQINFKCRRGQQCIGNILVCDKHKDCEDGSDEDPDFCRPPVTEGHEIDGKVIKWSCGRAGTSQGNDATIKFTKFKQSEMLPSYIQVEMSVYWSSGFGSVGSYHFNGFLEFATSSLRRNGISTTNAQLSTVFYFYPQEGIIVVKDAYSLTGEICGHSVYSAFVDHDFKGN